MMQVKLDPETEKAMRLERVEEFQKMAQALLDDPKAGAAFRRVGVSGDFTPQEHEAVYERCGLGRSYADENTIITLDYQAIIQALARRVAARVYRSVYDEEAHAFALSNTFVRDYWVPSNDNAIAKQLISFDDFLVVLREFMAWDKLQEHLDAFKTHVFDPHSGISQDDQLYDLAAPLDAKNKEIFRKYGHIGRFTVRGVAAELVREGKTADDIDAVRRHATMQRLSTRIKGIAK